MRDSLWKASVRWGYAAVCQPLPASIHDKKHLMNAKKIIETLHKPLASGVSL